MKEIEKYQHIYANPQEFRNYGHTNHGRKVRPELLAGHDTLLDVGCGFNEFVLERRNEGMDATGVDFACPGADIIAPAHSLPFPDKSFSLLTSFDMLEHLCPEEVPAALKEMARVSGSFIFSISYVPSVTKVRGETLHPTVRSRDWWVARIAEAGGRAQADGHYLVGEWGDPEPPPVKTGESVVLVGNGPSVLLAERGDLVDRHDQVIRFNKFQILGLEKNVGTKTTLWSTFGHETFPGDHGVLPDPTRAILIHENAKVPIPLEESWVVSPAFFDRIKQECKEASQREGEQREKTIPSSGLLVSRWLLEVYEVSQISLWGFDHFNKDAHRHSNRHHYWVDRAFGRPAEHDGEAEAAMFARLKGSGSVRYLLP